MCSRDCAPTCPDGVCRRQIRTTRKASVFPVGMILSLGVSSPIIRDGKVVGFHDGFQVGASSPLLLSDIHSHHIQLTP